MYKTNLSDLQQDVSVTESQQELDILFGKILPDEIHEEYMMSIQNTGNLQGTILMSGND